MSHLFYDLKKTLLTAGIVSLIIPIASVTTMAQTEQPAAEEGAATPSEANRQVVLSEQSLDGDFEITEANVDIVVSGGEHTINGNVQVNGAGDRIIISSDENEGIGRVVVNGSLVLGPDNAPTLGIDLSKVNLSKGSRFVIVDAAEILGEFAGLSNGMMTVGGYTLRIIYSKTSITMLVVSSPDQWRPVFTPVTMINPDLINPTSTAPIQ